MTSGISSLTMPQTEPERATASTKMSLLMMSSFFWSSPWTFSEPAMPSTPARAPLRTLKLIVLQASETLTIRRERTGSRS